MDTGTFLSRKVPVLAGKDFFSSGFVYPRMRVGVYIIFSALAE
jgi:hypothetical protein